MNKYQSHKIVEAARVTGFTQHDGGFTVQFEPDTDGNDMLTLSTETGERIMMMAAEVDPAQGTVIGGWVMVYKDGYISWAPNHTMEDYDLVQPSSGQSKIVGYRELGEEEIDLMNTVKLSGKAMGSLVDQLRECEGLDGRWISVGATHLQQGLMCLTRAIAKPDFF